MRLRQFAIGDIFPRDVGCDQTPYEAMGTPVDGGTLLHLALYWEELDMAEWLLDRGADPNALWPATALAASIVAPSSATQDIRVSFMKQERRPT